MIILPSVLASDWSNLRKEIELTQSLGLSHLHFDVMDGSFVPVLTFGPKFVADIRPYTKQFIDVHLMVDRPSAYIDDFAKAGADMCTFHIEAEKYSFRTLQAIRNLGMKAGIALNPQTPVSAVEAILDIVDLVLVMSVDPGFGGQSFIPQTEEKLRSLSQKRKEQNLGFFLSVDGGINDENIRLLSEKGVDWAVMGTSFFSQKDKEAYLNKLKKRLA